MMMPGVRRLSKAHPACVCLFVLLQFLVILFFSYYGEMSVAISPNPQLAAIMSSAVYSIWFIFAGEPR